MKKTFLIVCISMLCLAKASAQKVESYKSTQARILEPQSSAYVRPLTVSLKVITTERIRDRWTLTSDDVAAFRGSVSDIRSWGVYRSCKEHNCDVIVAATFNLQSDNTSKGFILEVVGYPAKYENWKTAVPADYEWIKLEKTYTTNEREKVSAIIK